jgi:GNAT superfamily N-acetyltransferase
MDRSSSNSNSTAAVSAVLVQQLIESDARYFELGASCAALDGAVLAWVPGLAALPAGCVVHRVKPESRTTDQWDEWLRVLEEQLAECGCLRARIYLEHAQPELEQVLSLRGYRRRVELLFLGMPAMKSESRELEIIPFTGTADLPLDGGLHAGALLGSDGYASPPELWSHLMQRKAATGLFHPFIIQHRGVVVGEFALMDMGQILRVKNLLIAPQARGRGWGSAVIQWAGGEAVRRDRSAIGVLEVEGSAGAALYQSCGLRVVGQLIEWSRER